MDWAVEPNTAGNSPITGYILEMDPLGDGVYAMIWNGTGRPDVLTYTITATTGVKYSFRHKSINLNGQSPYSTPL